MHAHNVYFSLNDNSDAAKEKLVTDCKTYLTVPDGIVAFACGTIEDEANRDVNDRDFDVSLHIWFADKAAHDAYQVHDSHNTFVERNRDNWKNVRVFDSSVTGAD